MCSDSRVRGLNDLGFSVIRTPRHGIQPGALVGRRGNQFFYLGPVASVLTAAPEPPQPEPAEPVAALSGVRTDQMNASFGLRLLAGMLQGLGVVVPQLKATYSRARQLQFEFDEVRQISIPAVNLGRYLAGATPQLRNPASAFLQPGKQSAYLITDVLESSALRVVATDASGKHLDVDVSAVAGQAGGKLSVEQLSDRRIRYASRVPVAFGFRALQLRFERERWALEIPQHEVSFHPPSRKALRPGLLDLKDAA